LLIGEDGRGGGAAHRHIGRRGTRSNRGAGGAAERAGRGVSGSGDGDTGGIACGCRVNARRVDVVPDVVRPRVATGAKAPPGRVRLPAESATAVIVWTQRPPVSTRISLVGRHPGMVTLNAIV